MPTVIVALAVTVPANADVDPMLADYSRMIREYFKSHGKEAEVTPVAVMDEKCRGQNTHIFSKCVLEQREIVALKELNKPWTDRTEGPFTSPPEARPAPPKRNGPWGTPVGISCCRDH